MRNTVFVSGTSVLESTQCQLNVGPMISWSVALCYTPVFMKPGSIMQTEKVKIYISNGSACSQIRTSDVERCGNEKADGQTCDEMLKRGGRKKPHQFVAVESSLKPLT